MRVWADVPDRWRELIEQAKEIEGWEKLSQYIRELIKKDLVSKGLLGQNFQNSSEVKEVTA